MTRHPLASHDDVNIGGAMAVPRKEAELKIPVGKPRFRNMNQLLTTRMPVGNCAALSDTQHDSCEVELREAANEPCTPPARVTHKA